jgi:predicted RNA-binding protein YlxR (DUF448 family)
MMDTPQTTQENEREERVSGPVRTCVGCAKPGAKEELVRVVLGPKNADGSADVAIDLSTAHGRGAHLHPQAACIAKAVRGGFSKAFKCNVHATPEELGAQVADAYEKRIVGLVLGARRAQLLAIGADATIDAMRSGAPLLVVANDAASISKEATFERAIADGMAVVWRSKKDIGALFGRDEVAVFAVLDGGVAAQVQVARSRSEACRRPEVR